MESPTARSPVRILIVEDNPADVFLIEQALKEHQISYLLQVIDDGELALSFVQRSAQERGEPCPDLVLMDLNMPKHDGTDVLRGIRQNPEYSAVPVVVLTSSESPRDEQEAMRLGATRFIKKPSNLDDFLRIGETLRGLVGNNGTGHE